MLVGGGSAWPGSEVVGWRTIWRRGGVCGGDVDEREEEGGGGVGHGGRKGRLRVNCCLVLNCM